MSSSIPRSLVDGIPSGPSVAGIGWITGVVVAVVGGGDDQEPAAGSGAAPKGVANRLHQMTTLR
jgi:hypothetical protein